MLWLHPFTATSVRTADLSIGNYKLNRMPSTYSPVIVRSVEYNIVARTRLTWHLLNTQLLSSRASCPRGSTPRQAECAMRDSRIHLHAIDHTAERRGCIARPLDSHLQMAAHDLASCTFSTLQLQGRTFIRCKAICRVSGEVSRPLYMHPNLEILIHLSMVTHCID